MSKLFKGRGQSDKDHEKQQPKAAFELRGFTILEFLVRVWRDKNHGKQVQKRAF